MGSRVLWFELAVGNDYLCEFGAAGKGDGAKKPATGSTATWGFTGKTAETLVEFAGRGMILIFSGNE
jgi:hypothetical protein